MRRPTIESILGRDSGEVEKEDAKENYITQSGKDIGMQTYQKVKRSAENRMVERHNHTTLIPVFGLNNLMIMRYNL